MRIIRALASPVTALLLFLTGMVAFAPAATANPLLPDTCVVSEDEWIAPAPGPWDPPSGSGPAQDYIGSTFTSAEGTYFYGATAYEWFGGDSALGLSTTNYIPKSAIEDRDILNPASRATCLGSPMSTMVSDAVGWFWQPALSLNGFAVSLFGISQQASLIPWFTDNIIVPLQQGTTDANGDGEPDGGLDDAWTLGIIAVAGITVGYGIYLIARGKFKESGKNMGWTVLAIGAASVLIAFPTALPRAATAAIEQVGSLFAATVSSAVQGTANDADGDWCRLSDDVNYPSRVVLPGDTEATALPSKQVRQMQCDLWVANSVGQWRLAQFGTREQISTVNSPAWDKASQDASIQVNIPGLANQPAAGDLTALHLATFTTNPSEQRWRDGFLAADPSKTTDADTLLRGTSKVPSDPDTNLYPAEAIYGASAPGGAYAVGKQPRMEALVTQMAALPGNSWSDWSGVGSGAPTNRIAAMVNLLFISATASVSIGLFSLFSLYYQLVIGLLVAVLPLAMIGIAMPFTVGSQIAKNYFAKLVESVVLVSLAMVFAVGAVFTSVVLPNLILGDALFAEGARVFYQPLIAGVGLVALIVAWRKVRKGFQSKIPDAMGADRDSAWNTDRKVSEKAGDVGKTAAMAGVVVGAGAVTGGTAGAALAAKGITAGAARTIAYTGKVGPAFKRGVRRQGISQMSRKLGPNGNYSPEDAEAIDEAYAEGGNDAAEAAMDKMEEKRSGSRRRRTGRDAPAKQARATSNTGSDDNRDAPERDTPRPAPEVTPAPAANDTRDDDWLQPEPPSAPAAGNDRMQRRASGLWTPEPREQSPRPQRSTPALPQAQRPQHNPTPPAEGEQAPTGAAAQEGDDGDKTNGSQLPKAQRLDR